MFGQGPGTGAPAYRALPGARSAEGEAQQQRQISAGSVGVVCIGVAGAVPPAVCAGTVHLFRRDAGCRCGWADKSGGRVPERNENLRAAGMTDAWRQHPMFNAQENLKRMFPGLGTGLCLYF